MSGSGRIRQHAEAGDWGHSSLNFWDNDYDALKQIVRAMKPGEVEDAGTAYTEMSTRMKTSFDLIRRQAGALAEAWGGDPAEQALAKMRKLHDAAHEIHAKSSETGTALKDHAATQRKWQSTIKDEHWYGVEIGTGDTGVGDWLQGESHMGRELMQQMQQDTVESNAKFPAALRADNITVDVGDFDPNGGGTGSGGAGAGGTGTGTGGGAGGGFPGSQTSDLHDKAGFPGNAGNDPPSTGGHLIGGSDSGWGSGAPSGSGSGGGSAGDPLPGSIIGGGDTSLAGLGPDAGGTGAPGAGMPGAGSGLGAGPSGLGSGAGGFSGTSGGAGGLGGGGGVVGGPGSGATGGRAAGRGGMMPMAPQSGQGDEAERERSTWLTEDEDVWNPGDGTTPPVIS